MIASRTCLQYVIFNHTIKNFPNSPAIKNIFSNFVSGHTGHASQATIVPKDDVS